jgi:hypothetical protein
VPVRGSGDFPAESLGQGPTEGRSNEPDGQERSGYVTFEPSGNVALTLDTRKSQVARFLAGPESTGAIQFVSGDSVIEMRADEDGPSLHAVRRKQVVFHEPPVENPQSTAICKALQEARKQKRLWLSSSTLAGPGHQKRHVKHVLENDGSG